MWIRTFTGRKIDFETFSTRDVCIIDIAHALSNLCRFTGHTKSFYCPTPDQRILTTDLEWVEAGNLKVGDNLVGFDETPTTLGGAGNRRRKFQPSVVLHAEPVKREVVRLEMEDGRTVTASAEHPWLVATKQSRNQKWLSSKQIMEDIQAGRKRYMHLFVSPWETISGQDSGWLAGIYDGEGSFSITNRHGVQLSVSQKPGLVLDKMKFLHRHFGFQFSGGTHPTSGVVYMQIRGGWRSVLQLLGQIRPIRLLDNFKKGLCRGDFAKQLDGKGAPSRIIRAYQEGTQWVSGLETSSRTYLCEGYGAHNSVGQHSILVASFLPDHLKLCGLLHDASEAYLGDVSKPLKELLPDYREIEDRFQRVIAEKFNIPYPFPKEIKEWDERVFVTEAQTLLEKGSIEWDQTKPLDKEPAPIVITPTPPEYTELCFVYQYSRLTSARGII